MAMELIDGRGKNQGMPVIIEFPRIAENIDFIKIHLYLKTKNSKVQSQKVQIIPKIIAVFHFSFNL